MVTASGSGLDPDISPKAAYIQVARIAKARMESQKSKVRSQKLLIQQINKLIKDNTEEAFLGMFGPEKVNVLKLNVALDRLVH